MVLRINTQKTCVKKICSISSNHYKLNSWHSWEDLYYHSWEENLHIDINMSSKWGKWLWTQIGFTNHLASMACFTMSKKWVQNQKCPVKTYLSYLGILKHKVQSRVCKWQPPSNRGSNKTIVVVFNSSQESRPTFWAFFKMMASTHVD